MHWEWRFEAHNKGMHRRNRRERRGTCCGAELHVADLSSPREMFVLALCREEGPPLITRPPATSQ